MPYHLPESNDVGLLYACVGVPDDMYHRAAFMGQLQELARWWTWERDDAHSGKEAAAVWQTILEDDFAIRDTGCVECPGFYLNINDVNCPNIEGLRTSRIVNECGACPDRESVYFSRSIVDITSGIARIGYSCHDYIDDAQCGGRFCTIRAYQTGIGSPSWVLQWRDCFGQDHSELQQGNDEFFFFDVEAIWICLTLNSNFCAVVEIGGPVLCGVA